MIVFEPLRLRGRFAVCLEHRGNPVSSHLPKIYSRPSPNQESSIVATELDIKGAKQDELPHCSQ